MNDVITFMGGDIPLFVLRTDELQPVISIAIRVPADELPPFGDIVCTDGFVAGLFRDNGIREMDIRVNKLPRLYTGRANSAGIGRLGGVADGILGKCQRQG